MRYNDEVVEEVRARSDIVEVISSYVKLTRKGKDYSGLCPFHNEKTPSFYVSPSKQMFYCFGCGAGGNVFSFLMQYENQTFSEALSALADRAGIPLPKMEYSAGARKAAKEREDILGINKLAAKYFYYQLRAQEGNRGLAYLKERGLSEDTIRRFGLGYASGSSGTLYQYLKKEGWGDETLARAGLFVTDPQRGLRDKFYSRVMFPIMDVQSRVVGFGGRVMGEGKPKYLNSPETLVFDKSRTLYGLNLARSTREDSFLLCEGYMDVITMHQAGFANAVASLGTSLTSGHASLLKRYAKKVLLLYDSDGAGLRAALRAIPILKEAGVDSRVVSLAPYKDPDEFLKAEGKDAFRKRLEGARDSFLFRVDQAAASRTMQDPQDQNRFFDDCAALLLELEDELERNLYVEAILKEYSRYGIGAEDLRRRVRTQAMKGVRLAPRAVESAAEPARPGVKKLTADRQAQKLMLTWLVTWPAVFDYAVNYLKPEDFTVPLYREAAEMLYEQRQEGDVNPARLLNAFPDSEDQKEVASLFHASIRLEGNAQLAAAFADALLRIREDSLRDLEKKADRADMQANLRFLQATKDLQELKKRKQELITSFPIKETE